MKKVFGIGIMLFALLALVATPVFAAVTFDTETGVGFVGKGDVQLVYGWNDKALQNNAGEVQFRVISEVVTEVSWIATNTNNDQIQERSRTTTTSISGIFSSVSREILKGGNSGKVNGFNLTGYDGVPTISSETEGPAVNSIPSGPWELTTPAGDPEIVSETGGVQVSINGTDWFDLN
ncbi:MAG: hypothetical protein Q8Q07_00540 [Dehalococcoidales bacterium]|nr:hypothetical protein [Dehalococcoidales bacterium]